MAYEGSSRGLGTDIRIARQTIGGTVATAYYVLVIVAYYHTVDNAFSNTLTVIYDNGLSNFSGSYLYTTC